MPSLNHRSHAPDGGSSKRKISRQRPEMSYLELLDSFEPFSQLNTKLARAKAQDAPVLYAQILPGLDVLLCRVRGVQPPYPAATELHASCKEAIADALEQPLDGLDNGGYWYEVNGFGFLVFTSRSRERVLAEFGALGPRARTGNTR